MVYSHLNTGLRHLAAAAIYAQLLVSPLKLLMCVYTVHTVSSVHSSTKFSKNSTHKAKGESAFYGFDLREFLREGPRSQCASWGVCGPEYHHTIF